MMTHDTSVRNNMEKLKEKETSGGEQWPPF
jgi:hypothetical protein